MTFRFGSALILIGLITLVVFALGLSVQQADVRALLGGAALCALGLILRHRAARSAASRAFPDAAPCLRPAAPARRRRLTLRPAHGPIHQSTPVAAALRLSCLRALLSH